MSLLPGRRDAAAGVSVPSQTWEVWGELEPSSHVATSEHQT